MAWHSSHRVIDLSTFGLQGSAMIYAAMLLENILLWSSQKKDLSVIIMMDVNKLSAVL